MSRLFLFAMLLITLPSCTPPGEEPDTNVGGSDGIQTISERLDSANASSDALSNEEALSPEHAEFIEAQLRMMEQHRETLIGLEMSPFAHVSGTIRDELSTRGEPLPPEHIRRYELVVMALSSAQEAGLHIPDGVKVFVEEHGDQVTVTFDTRLAPGEMGADYSARVFIDSNLGEVEVWQ